jgi:predicted nucleic acid-binding protein
MKYFLDSSAIFRAVRENKIEVLRGNYTLDLARYELGNIIWKDYALQAKVSGSEAKMMAKTIKHTIALMDVVGIDGSEEEILETAIQLKITFYDASYVYLAKIKQLKLITEDSRLIKKIATSTNVSTLDDIL